VVDGIFMLGEAKKEGRLGGDTTEEEKNIRKYGSLAEALSAERLLFATIDEKWADTTVERAERLLKDHDVECEFVARDVLGYL